MTTQLMAQSSNNFLLPNATFFAELFAFVVILFVLYRWVLPPLNKALQERQGMIQKQVEDSEEAARRLRAAEERYQSALAEARTEAAKIRDAARADADRIRVELREQADQEVARIHQRGDEQLAAEREQAVRELRSQIGELSLQLASRIVGQELDGTDRRGGTIDRFLEELDEMPERQSTSDGGRAPAATRADQPAGSGGAG
jgi:F-type H+-transporting ATPase subunit b